MLKPLTSIPDDLRRKAEIFQQETGVDMTQIARNLLLTPDERVRRLQSAIDSLAPIQGLLCKPKAIRLLRDEESDEI
jgi:hypothetical protein